MSKISLCLIVVLLVMSSCGEKPGNCLQPVTGLAASAEAQLSKASGLPPVYYDASGVFPGLMVTGNADITGTARVGQLYLAGIYGTVIDDNGKGFFNGVYSERGYFVDGGYILQHRAVNPGPAEHITAAPLSSDYNRLADKYNLLLFALQKAGLVGEPE